MDPRNIGRALGIGVRVAGRIAGQGIAGPAPSDAGPPRAKTEDVPPAGVAPQVHSQAQAAGRTVRKGISSLLGPFRRVGGIVWLEVTGTFFLLFAVLFALRLWQNWKGIGQVSKVLSIGAGVVFLYLGISSFWRARRR